MSAVVRIGLISQLVQSLPGPVLRLLDAWSHRIAQRRAAQRIRRWQRAQAAAAKSDPGIAYRPKPWRD